MLATMPQPSLSLPTEQDAVTIVEAVLQRPVLHVHRFPTGLCHYVYDVVLDNRQQVVARLARADTQALLAGGVAWSHVLRPRGVPLPRLLHADVTATQLPFAFMLLEHLPGVDLGQTYPYLSRHQKQAIAAAVVRIQRQVHRLPQGNGYGYATAPHAVLPHRSWATFVEQIVLDAQHGIAHVGVVDVRHVDRVHRQLPRFRSYLDAVDPMAFLDDTTTKNVLIDRGAFTGIVDVDEVCYGDPLWTVALTQMALLKQGEDLDYIAAWTALLNLTKEHHRVLSFYTAVFCLIFLSELGQVYNQSAATPVEAHMVYHLTTILDDLVNGC